MTPLMLLADGYKLDHRRQYPPGTTGVYSNFTPRKGRSPGDGVVFFGLRYFVEEYLESRARSTFFDRDLDDVVQEYQSFLDGYLGPNRVGTDHIAALHGLGYLPLEIRAVPEGSVVQYGVPMLTIENTHPGFYWLTNYFETLLSCVLWGMCTSATTAYGYRKLLDRYAQETGGDPAFVQWQGHDFSFRGMFGPEAAALSGAGHLLSFTGTDSIPAIGLLQGHYDGRGLVGGSVPATEHSVMCAGGDTDERATIERLLDLYPNGILSIVSDTWDLWRVVTEHLPALRGKIMARSGKLVVRPDSGDPVKIICGDPDAPEGSPASYGVVDLLCMAFGGKKNAMGYVELDSHLGVIYGDSITLERAEAICEGLKKKGYASTNVVLGIGSYTYQYTTRDVHGFAMKATWAMVDGEERLLYKDPVTDDGSKRSARGRLVVDESGLLHDGCDRSRQGAARALHGDRLEPVWRDGSSWRPRVTLGDIRARLLGSG